MIVAAILSAVIGVVLGMLGGGGAILTLPMLIHAAGMDPKTAIATSLFVVGATSLAATVMNARARVVAWRTGLTFGAAAMAGAFAGGRLAAFVPAAVLLVLFAAMMLVTAVAMLRDRRATSAPAPALALGRALGLGAGVGVLSGLVGAGGGFLIVPALATFGGLTMRRAIATSLFVIGLQSFAGFAGHAGHVGLDWPLVVLVTTAAVVGTIAGTFAGRRVSADGLRRGFAWLVVAMGLFVLAGQVPMVVTSFVAVVTVTAIVLVRRPRAAHP